MPDQSGFDHRNLPYGVVRPPGADPRPAVRLGDDAIDLRALAGLLDVPAGTFDAPTLNRFLALGRDVWSATRARLIELIDAGHELPLIPLKGSDLLLPV